MQPLTETGLVKKYAKTYYHNLKTQNKEIHMNRETSNVTKNSIYRYRSVNHRRLE